MRWRTIAALVVAVVLAGCSAPRPSGAPTSEAVALEPGRYAVELQEAVDRTRSEHDLRTLEVSPCAQEQALIRAEALRGRPLEHADLAPVMSDCGSEGAAENLSRASASPAEVVEAWLASPGHRSNLLAVDPSAQGLACVVDDGQVLCSHVLLTGVSR